VRLVDGGGRPRPYVSRASGCDDVWKSTRGSRALLCSDNTRHRGESPGPAATGPPSTSRTSIAIPSCTYRPPPGAEQDRDSRPGLQGSGRPAGINQRPRVADAGKIVALTYVANGFIKVDTADRERRLARSTRRPPTGAVTTTRPRSGVFNNPNEYFVTDQWQRAGAYPDLPRQDRLCQPGGDVPPHRAHDATGGSYTNGGQPTPRCPGRQFVMWVSNMKRSSRYDTFIARNSVR